MAFHPPLSELDRAGTESVLRAIFVNASDAIGISHRTVIRVVNPSMLRMFGFDQESDMLGRSFLDFMTPESGEVLVEYVRRRALGEDVPGRYRAEGVRRDGTHFLVDITTTTFQQDGEAFALALLREVGEGRRAAELYEAIFERNTAVKLLIDPTDGRIVDANQAAASFYGWPVEELRTKRITEINTLTGDEVAQEMESARLGKRRYFRFRHRAANGAVRHVDVHTGPVQVAGRTLLLSIVQDTTERDALEDQLRQSQKLEAIGRLAGGVAHDFNNLLTVVMSCADLIRGELPDEGRGPKLLDDLTHAAERASELTAELLSVGQRQHLRPEPVRVDEVVGRMEGILARAVGPGVTLQLDLEPDLTVQVDPGRLEQIVMNLVLNARDATNGSGRIQVSAHRLLDAVALRVRDDGRGMDEATRARVFEPFFSTKPDTRGTGLGLASVYGVVTQSGGKVSVESEPGKGATFTVLLPLCEGAPCGEPPVAPESTVSARVLLVDDERDVRDVLQESMERAGFEVISMASGDEALELPDEVLARIDVLVTDQVMPGRSGVELALALLERWPRLPVILISGHGPAQERARLPEGTAFLQKPFSGTELNRTIRCSLRPR